MRGKVTEIKPTHVTLEVAGIGYHLLIANPFRLSAHLVDMPDHQELNMLSKHNDTSEDEICTLYIYQHIAQDQIRLYGFVNVQEKDLFMKLIGVSGIGPKSALSILALEDHIGLVQAIESADTKYLQKFPGVGKKTASQIILDLQGKLADLSPELVQAFGTSQKAEEISENIALNEAAEALEVLGYTARDRNKVIKKLEQLEQPLTTDEYIRHALSLLMKA